MERDPFLRRLEREAIAACFAMAAIALVVRRGDARAALGVLAGGALIAVSYLAIKAGVDGALRAASAKNAQDFRGWRRVWALVKFFTRYAILALAAYVVIVRFRLHPAAVVAGASSLVIAAALEAIRSARAASRSEHPRNHSM